MNTHCAVIMKHLSVLRLLGRSSFLTLPTEFMVREELISVLMVELISSFARVTSRKMCGGLATNPAFQMALLNCNPKAGGIASRG